MVEIHVRKDSRQRLSSFFAEGHAGWADSGQDVVCAAVSTMLQTAWLGLAEVAEVHVHGERDAGRLLLSWPAEARADRAVTAIVTTAALAIERIALQYPDHIKVLHEREPS